MSLSDEQEFAILRQSPELVGNDKFELVYLITYLLHLRSYGVVIGNSLLVLVLNLVGYLAGIDQFLHTSLNDLCAFSHLFDNLLVA